MSTQNAAHTPGPWLAKKHGVVVGGAFHRYTNGKAQSQVALATMGNAVENEAERDANAALIAEAGTVTTETGLTPRQLAEQRAELLEALRGIMHYAGMGASVCDVYTKEEPAFIAAYAAIAKATGSAK